MRTNPAFGELSLSSLLDAFAAGNEVPGSGSANALAAAIAACLTASVAVKTNQHRGPKYRHAQQTAVDAERRARQIAAELQGLIDKDSAAFAPVIAIRRIAGRVDDPLKQDQALRNEIAALKPATEIPLRIAELSGDIAELAVSMLDSGFKPARGESYTALAQAIAAIDGALHVAQLNIRSVKQKIAKLNDPELESDWIRRILRAVKRIRQHWFELRVREQLARRALHNEIFPESPDDGFMKQRLSAQTSLFPEN